MSGLSDLDPAAFAELRRLLDEGLDLPGAERAAWLAALPAAQQPLRERLERLLAEAAADSGEAFQTLPPIAASDTAAAPDLPGDIGPWRPSRLLGEGGMGTVWLAERVDGLLKRPAALKLPRGAWRQAGLAERMARERDILARLDHPHIAPILDAGVTPEGQPWLALAYVEGQPIDEYVSQRQLGLRERIGLLLQVAGAVAHAHARLVVHRDLKPGNILVTPEGEVRLLDFGIGKLLDDEAAEGLALTQQLGRVMTPWYASPEQVQAQPIGTASDVYALGVVAFELLTGQRPYALQRETRVELEQAIVQGRLQRPSAAATTPWAAQLRGDLDTVLLKALKTDPDERYRTVDQFADDLQRWLRQRPVSAQPDRLAYRVRKFVQRNRLGVGLGTAAVAALAVALGVALWQREQARLEAAKANGIKDYLVSLFETNDVDQADALRKRGQSVQDLLEHSARTLGSGLADHPEVRDELQMLVGQLLQDLELSASALKLRQERVQALQALQAPALRQAEALRALAQSQYWSDDARGARTTLDQARQLCEPLGDTVGCLGVQSDLGQMEFDARHLDRALALTQPVVAQLRQIAPASAELAQALELLGNIELARNEVEESLARFRESMDIRRTLFGERSVRLATLRYRLGRNLWVARQLSQAESEFRAARAITLGTLGEAHPQTLRIEVNLGRLTSFIGVRTDGLQMLAHAVQQMLAMPEPMPTTEVLQARVALGSALLLDGHLERARGELDAAMALRAQLGPEQVYSDPSLDQSWARLLLDTGRYADARHSLETMHRRIVATYGADHPLVADALIRQASVALAERDLSQATRLLDQALSTQDSREAAYGSPKHRAQLLQATVLLDSGRPLEVAPLLEPGFEVARSTPRGDLFRDPLFQLTMLMARLRCAQGRHADGEVLFERAIALMRPANASHPLLIDAHARHALCLAGRGALEPARAQWQQAETLWAAQPGLGPHLRRGLDEVRRQTWARASPP
ncbi:protein kinase [Ideonella sp. 4Y11]|uniref:Protein kinase n=1 Tax=Ideonella aquatica TaxID=2824119 RepID=A0A940YSC1_9BURK|nr:protein kinase [Ideonella aquatica]MBQ0958495.1 protein kinase [Ideonella aquatica]